MPLVFYDRGSSDWTLSQGLFRRAGLLPNVVLEVEGIEAAKRMVERALGLSFLPQIAGLARVAAKASWWQSISQTRNRCGAISTVIPSSRRRPLTRDAQAFLLLLQA